MIRAGLWFTIATALLASSAASADAAADGRAVKFAETTATKAKLKLLKPSVGDFDGDGQRDVVAACQKRDKKIHFCVFANGGKELFFLADKSVGTKLKKIERTHLVPPETADEVVIEGYDENPDEKIKRIRIYAGYRKPRELFDNAIFRAKDKSRRPAWERETGVIKYGDARAGWYFIDLEEDGTMEIVVRRKPQVLTVPRVDDDPARLLTGVRESVFEFLGNPDSGIYAEREKKRFTDFLPAYPIAGVRSASAWMPKDEYEDLKANALADAVYAAAEGEKVEPPEVDLTPYFERGADQNLDTGWIENAKGPGRDEWLEVDLGEAQDIRMVRVVGGCVADKRTYKQFNRPTRYELRFDNGERTTVDLRTTGKPERPAVAVMELPVRGRDYAKQTLVFFKGDNVSRTVRLTIEGVQRQGRGNHTCISEVSVH